MFYFAYLKKKIILCLGHQLSKTLSWRPTSLCICLLGNGREDFKMYSFVNYSERILKELLLTAVPSMSIKILLIRGNICICINVFFHNVLKMLLNTDAKTATSEHTCCVHNNLFWNPMNAFEEKLFLKYPPDLVMQKSHIEYSKLYIHFNVWHLTLRKQSVQHS